MAALSRVRLSPWLIALVALSLALDGPSPYLWAGLACVLLHEGGHALCARACGCAVEGVDIAPFGGVVTVRGLDQLSAGRSVLVALAGPLVNAFLAAFCLLAAQNAPQHGALLARLTEINLALLLLNLLPAYPLDGGRMLCALLQRRAGLMRAQRVCAGLGMALGLLLCALGVLSLRYVGKLHLTLLLSGGYTFLAALREMRGSAFSYLRTMAHRGAELRRRRILPVRTIAVPEGTADAELYARLLPGALYRVIYLDEDLRVTRSAWESELMGGIYRRLP